MMSLVAYTLAASRESESNCSPRNADFPEPDRYAARINSCATRSEAIPRVSYRHSNCADERNRSAARFKETRVVSTFVRDLHAALRSFRTNPGLALAVIVTLGLGIGADTSMFSVVSAVLLRPLPYQEPAELVRVWPQFWWSKAWLSDVREQTDSFSAVSGYAGIELTLTGGSQPVIVEGVRARHRARPLLLPSPSTPFST